jgi:hypothetical protein
MSPLREATSWTDRFQDDTEIEPLKRYYLIFEGIQTEIKYFEGLVNERKLLGINNMIELIILHKEGDIQSHSHPKRLLELINEKKQELVGQEKYDKDIDEFVIVFDRDSYKDGSEYLDFISISEPDNLLAVTSPCFELWLILHKENSVEDYILEYETEILANHKVSNQHTYTSKLFSDLFQMNPKSNIDFEVFKDSINMAISQEQKICRSIREFTEKVGSNIGSLIELFRGDPRQGFL